MLQTSKPKLWLCVNEWGSFIANRKKRDEVKKYDPEGEETQVISEVEFDNTHTRECGGGFYGSDFGIKKCERCKWEIRMDLDSHVVLLNGEIYRKVEQ